MIQSSPLISVILPTYNEAGNILEMIDEVAQALAGKTFEIIVVDDDSPDGTSDLVKRAQARIPNLELVTRTRDPGLVNSIWEGIQTAKGEICVWMDADLSMPADRISSLVEEVQNGADLALGSRYVEGGRYKGADIHSGKENFSVLWRNIRDTEDSLFAILVSKYGNLFAGLVLDSRYHDYTSGFYAVKKCVILKLGVQGNYLDYCIRLLYKASLSGLKIAEIPITVVPRIHGKSKTSSSLLNVIGLSVKCIVMIVLLRFESRDKKSFPS